MDMNMAKPLLSIGIIFKNNIRSLDRCLSALTPLRRAVPCELVMADTGSDDGSREVAARYADILIDFPWVNDFAAARNAVMNRCSGQWHIAVDTDEYLDEDISELTDFLTDAANRDDAATVVIRNYSTYEMDSTYSDFMALRLVRLSLGVHYSGAIHEALRLKKAGTSRLIQAAPLMRTVFRHDGYVDLGGEAGKAKRERNISLLRKKLEKEPDNLVHLLQFIESGFTEPDQNEHIRRAAELVEEKAPGWQLYGPPIFRYAAAMALNQSLPELEDWVRRSEEWFPNSYFTRIDVASLAFIDLWQRKDTAGCIQRGEKILEAYRDYRAGRGEIAGQLHSTIHRSSPYSEQSLRVVLADSYRMENQPEKSLDLLRTLDFSLLDANEVGSVVVNLMDLHGRNGLDASPAAAELWRTIQESAGSKRAEQCRTTFIAAGSASFSDGGRGHTVFLPLSGQCELGTAAAILESERTEEIEKLLCEVRRWNEFPISALLYAIRRGIAFPPKSGRLTLEDMDSLAARLAQDAEELFRMTEASDNRADLQAVTWRRSLVLAGVRVCGWKEAERGMMLVRAFIHAERAFLSVCYAQEALRPETLFMLPAMHRFGWYCAQAFDALDDGNAAGYARHLREGLETCESMKPMVEFLLEHTPELQISEPKPSGELLELAEKVRVMLSAYAPDDPAVVMIKSSPAYQKVATLIEGPGMALVGGLKQ